MKAHLFLLLATGLSIASQGQVKTGQEPYLTKSLANESVKNVEVETSGGSITIAGVPASETRVEVYINRNGNRDGELTKEEAKQRLEADYDLDVSVSGGTVIAKAKPKRNNMDWKRALNISFKVYTPQTVSTKLSTSGGSISLTNLSGDQRFSTSGGSLHIEKLSGKTKGSTSGGSIYVKDSKDDIDLSTSGGSIEATDCTGNIELSTSGGSLKLQNLNGTIDASTSGGNVEGEYIEGDLSAHTSGGNIELSELACSLETSTSGGNIDVAIKTLNKSVKISNSGGNIRVQLPKGAKADLNLHAGKINTDKMEAFSGTIEEDEVQGKLNGGGVSVTVRAGSGRVSLSFQ